MNRLLSVLGAQTSGEGGGPGVVFNRTVFVSLLAEDGDGSAGAPFGSLNEAVAALPEGGAILVAPGNFSGESFSLDSSKPYAFISMAAHLVSVNGQVQQSEYPLFPSFNATGGAGGSLHFEGIAFTGSHDVAATGMPAVYVGCTGINTNASFVYIIGGGGITLQGSGVYNAVIEGADLFNSYLELQSALHLHNCNSWGQALSVAFPGGSPPGCYVYYDMTTAGHAGGAPTVSDGQAILLGEVEPTYAPEGVVTSGASVYYNWNASDAGKYYRFTTNGAEIYVPTNYFSAGAVPVGTRIKGVGTSGGLIIDPQGKTVNVPAGFQLATRAAFSPFELIKVGASTWDLSGDLLPV